MCDRHNFITNMCSVSLELNGCSKRQEKCGVCSRLAIAEHSCIVLTLWNTYTCYNALKTKKMEYLG